jgi:hypothetical protein
VVDGCSDWKQFHRRVSAAGMSLPATLTAPCTSAHPVMPIQHHAPPAHHAICDGGVILLKGPRAGGGGGGQGGGVAGLDG